MKGKKKRFLMKGQFWRIWTFESRQRWRWRVDTITSEFKALILLIVMEWYPQSWFTSRKITTEMANMFIKYHLALNLFGSWQFMFRFLGFWFFHFFLIHYAHTPPCLRDMGKINFDCVICCLLMTLYSCLASIGSHTATKCCAIQ